MELADQEGGGLSGQFLDVDVDGRQEWVGQGRKDGIVEADQGDVVRHFVLVQLQILQDPQGQAVIADDKSGRFGLFEELLESHEVIRRFEVE